MLAETASAKPLVSPLAVGDGTLRRGVPRTLPVYGLCVHTTGSGPAEKAKRGRSSALQIALDYYVHGGEGFPHYLIGYDGTINAICDEGRVAWHAGWFARGGKKRWAVWQAPAWWSAVWRPRNIATPADLLPPRAGDPNSVYIGVELLGDTTGWGFTTAQYDALARLVVDVFRRHGVPLSEPPNPRLLGHEDLEPVERANAAGGWDPGAHRSVSRFSWPTLSARIGVLARTAAHLSPTKPLPVSPPASNGFVGAIRGLLQGAFGAATPALGAAEAAASVALGERDANRLTDIVFYARHGERGGRPIARGEEQLAEEWRRLRESVVVPALRQLTPTATAGAAPGSSSASAFTRSVPSARRWGLLVALLDRYRGDIPLEFLLGWVAVESDARIDVVTSLDERGFFQIHPAESKDARPPLQHLRLSTDPDYSVQAGIQIVRAYADLARRRFPWIPSGSELFWRVVKLQHAMGSGLAWNLLTQMRARGIETTWEAIKRAEVGIGPRLHRLLATEPGRFGRNVDRVFSQGRVIARSLGR